VNYIAEIKAFNDWLESMPQVSTTAIALWYALMFQANKTGWKDEFSVAVATLELRTGMKRGAVYTARSSLRRFGLIEVRERGGNLAAVYRMRSLCSFNERRESYSMDYSPVHTSAQKGGSLNNKQYDTKRNYINTQASAGSGAWGKGTRAGGKAKKISFINYEQHERDYDEIGRMSEIRLRDKVLERSIKDDES